MKRLKLLGGAYIDAGDAVGGAVTGRAVQRRRIALLALLVIRQPVGISRDKLIAYLWPDADSERGRHLLSDSVYRINQELGSETIVPAGDELRLDCEAVGCDVLEFETAFRTHDFAHAATVYAGPFLDGFFLSECVELERWIERERDRLCREYLSTLEALGETASAAGDHEGAVAWWRRAATHDPYNSRIALRLMQSLAAAGNRPGALQHAQIHSALVRSDFGTEPDKALTEYAERLKRGDEPRTSAPPAAAAEHGPSVGASQPGTPSSEPTVATAAAADSARSIAVLPFVNLSADPETEYFADGISDELTAALDRIDGLNVAARTSAFAFKGKPADIREVAERLRVGSVVEGSVRKEGRRLRIAARLIDATSGYRLWSDDYDRELSDVLEVQADIARAIATALQQRIARVGLR